MFVLAVFIMVLMVDGRSAMQMDVITTKCVWHDSQFWLNFANLFHDSGSVAVTVLHPSREADDFIATMQGNAQKANFVRNMPGDFHRANVLLTWNATTMGMFINATRAKYLILLLNDDPHQCNITSDTPHHLWTTQQILNVFVVRACNCNATGYYTFNPFIRNSDESWGRTLWHNFNKKLPQVLDFNNHPLRVTMFERSPTAIRNLSSTMSHYRCIGDDAPSLGFAGFDGCVLDNLAHYLRLHPELVKLQDDAGYGYQMANGTYVGSLGDLAYRRAEFAGNSRFSAINRELNIEFTEMVSQDVVCFIVPKAKRMPQWIMIFHCFKPLTWAALLISGPLIALCYNCFRRIKFPQFTQRETSLTRDLIDILGLILSISMNHPPVVTNQRIIIVTCLMFNVIIVGIFQGSLFTSFSTISFYKDLSTMQELYDSNLPIATNIDMFKDGSDILRKLGKRLVDIPEKAITRAARSRNVVAVERKRDAKFLAETTYLADNGLHQIHIVPECPISFYLAYTVTKGSPFLGHFNKALTRFAESGLLQKWSAEFTDALIIKSQFKIKNHIQVLRPFKFMDVQTPFYILALGWMLGGCAFLGEIVARYMRRRNKADYN